jgi:hypothetical protein
VCGLSGCKKQVANEEQTPEATPPPKQAAATPEAKPVAPESKPVAMATPTPVPTTPAPQFAPPGVYYLITSVSVTTSDGILGLKPGQKLQQVRPGVYRADNVEVTLRPDQVTNDLSIAGRLVTQEQQNQAAIQQRLATLAAPHSSLATPGQAGSPASGASKVVPTPTVDPKFAARDALIKQRSALQVQLSKLAASLDAVSTKEGTWAMAARKSPQAFALLQQYNALQKQIQSVDSQLDQIR